MREAVEAWAGRVFNQNITFLLLYFSVSINITDLLCYFLFGIPQGRSCSRLLFLSKKYLSSLSDN